MHILGQTSNVSQIAPSQTTGRQTDNKPLFFNNNLNNLHLPVAF